MTVERRRDDRAGDARAAIAEEQPGGIGDGLETRRRHGSRTVTPEDVAAWTRRWAHSRTWVTDPGAEVYDGSDNVWIESTTQISGRSSVMWWTMFATDVSDDSSRLSCRAPRRSARRRT